MEGRAPSDEFVLQSWLPHVSGWGILSGTVLYLYIYISTADIGCDIIMF